MAELMYPEESYKIIGACFNVYRTMGCGFLEPVYQECMGIEFECEKIPFIPQADLKLFFRERELQHSDKADFICNNKIIVELKAVDCLTDKHRAQVINYLNATKFKLGLLVNFGSYPKLEYERLLYSEYRNEIIKNINPNFKF